MASNLVTDYDDELMDWYSDVESDDSGNDIAMINTAEETLIDNQSENEAATPSTVDLITALQSTPTIGNSEPEAGNTTLLSSNTEKVSGIQNTDDTLPTEVDGMADDENMPSTLTIGNSELEAENTAPPSSNTDEASDNQNTDDTLSTEANRKSFSFISDEDDDEGLHVIIKSQDPALNMRLLVIVSMVSPCPDGFGPLVYTGDFILEVNPSTSIRDVKYGITESLEICYEDITLVFIKKFLTDSCTLQNYIFYYGHPLHLLVETNSKLFKDVFATFKRLTLGEEKACIATRGFVKLMAGKYNEDDGFGNDETPELTEELLLHELQELFVLDSDDSDDSDNLLADENEPDIANANIENIVSLGGIELELMSFGANSDENENPEESLGDEQNSDDEEQNFDNDDFSSDDEDETEEENEDDFFDFLAQVLYHLNSAHLFED